MARKCIWLLTRRENDFGSNGREIGIVRYCSNCGEKIPVKAKFCVYCGSKVEPVEPLETEPPVVPELVRETQQGEVSDPAFKLLEPGTVFQGYRIIRLMNKDPGGIKYIAERDGNQFILKLYFKTEFAGLNSTLGLLSGLKRLGKMESSHIAHIVEVNQAHTPPYSAAEFVSGVSLAKIKNTEPERFSEPLVREIAKQLVATAIAIHKQGLSLQDLNLSGIMLQDDGSIVILSSGINTKDADEKQEIFNIGVLLSQLLSRNTLYSNLYSAERLSEQKFNYIPGTSISLNKVLADCLHRNVIQRYSSLVSLQHALNGLSPVVQDDIYVAKPRLMGNTVTIDATEAPKLKTGIEWWFWLALGLITVILALMLTTNLFAILFGGRAQPFQFTNIFDSPDSTEVKQDTQAENLRRYAVSDTNRARRERARVANKDPRLDLGTSSYDDSPAPAPAVKKKVPMPASFVYVEGGTFGFNRLKENLNHNVSQSGFYISKYEVTQAEWNKFMMPAEVNHMGDRYPVDNVSWMNAIRYCNVRSEDEGLDPVYKISGSNAGMVSCDFTANGYRLPTEAEWEMAAKGGELYTYSGSDDPEAVAWYRENSSGRTRMGAGKQANDLGLYDMTGNVSEWCWDWFDAKYPYTLTTFVNPSGPKTGLFKVVRGGNVTNGEGVALRISTREKGNPERGYQFVGFRLVRRGDSGDRG